MNNIPKVSPPKLLDDDRKNLLSQLIPESVEDGKINVEKIKESLGEFAEDEATNEHFELTWPGKREAKKVAITASKGTLVPAPGEGVDEEKTKNLFIEGENLEVLKLLHKSYMGQIKIIYIDPPYNTGKDFVYSDKFSDSIEEYRRVTGQVDSEGREMETNKKSEGRFHSRWLSMMYPRLKLAKDLLKDDGVIFVSIDDNEVHNLRAVMNEIFGEENFISIFIWHKKTQPSFLSKEVANVTEYLVAYKKNSEDIQLKGGMTDPDKMVELLNISNQFADRVLPKEKVIFVNENWSGNLKKGNYGTEALNVELKNDIVITNGKPDIDVEIRGRVKWTQDTINKSIDDGSIIYIKSIKSLRPTLKRIGNEANIKPPISLLSKYINNIPTNTDANNEIKKLFDGVAIMDYPKPIGLIKYLIEAVVFNDNEAIVLDFFAGSGTTAHAALQLNTEDRGSRQFIMVQMPEVVASDSEAFKAGYKNIAEISKERIRRAGKKIKEETKAEIDYGFKVFKLQKSNYRDQDELLMAGQQSLDFADLTDPLVKGWKPENLLTEIILLEGFPLNSKVEQLATIQTNKVQVISCDDTNRTYKLFVCLDEKIDPQTITGLTFEDEDKFICLDSAISDTDKLTLSDKAHLKVI